MHIFISRVVSIFGLMFGFCQLSQASFTLPQNQLGDIYTVSIPRALQRIATTLEQRGDEVAQPHLDGHTLRDMAQELTNARTLDQCVRIFGKTQGALRIIDALFHESLLGAFSIYNLLADHRCSASAYILGVMLLKGAKNEKGEALPKNRNVALNFFIRAAQYANPQQCLIFGQLSLKDSIVKVNGKPSFDSDTLRVANYFFMAANIKVM